MARLPSAAMVPAVRRSIKGVAAPHGTSGEDGWRESSG